MALVASLGIDVPGEELFELIEELGGMLVSDNLCIDARYSVNQVNEKGDPMNALADRYPTKPACLCMHQGSTLDEPCSFTTTQVKENRRQRVVFGLQRFCDTRLVDYQTQRYRLEKDNIPFVYHEVESAAGVGRVRTQLEAFLEIIEGGQA